MNKILLLVVALAALLSMGGFAWYEHHKHNKKPTPDVIPTPVYDLWVHWKNKHGKKYASPTEEKARLQIFYTNYKTIQTHMQNPKRTFDMGFNKFMDLTSQEFGQYYLSYRDNSFWRKRNVKSFNATPANSVDWRTKGAVTGVKNQGQCGSCWAFSTTGSLEGAHFLKTGTLTSFSEQQLVDCSGSYGNQGCNGGLMDYAFQYVEAKGISTEAEYPYTGYDGSCQKDNGSWKISGYTDVPAGSTSELKSACNTQPVSVAVDAESWQFYSGGVFSNCGTSLDHGVLLVGYTSDYWIVKNSWGGDWGEDGYIRLATGNTCGIANSASTPQA
jgi:C1A family cysteine protease